MAVLLSVREPGTFRAEILCGADGAYVSKDRAATRSFSFLEPDAGGPRASLAAQRRGLAVATGLGGFLEVVDRPGRLQQVGRRALRFRRGERQVRSVPRAR